MRATIILSVLLAGCSGTPSNEQSSSSEGAPQAASASQDAPVVSNQTPMVTSASETSYRAAITCYTLADGMDIVSTELDRPELRASGLVRADWEAEANRLGRSIGKSRSQVKTDHEDEYLRMMAPLKTMSAADGAKFIEALARRLAGCGRPAGAALGS